MGICQHSPLEGRYVRLHFLALLAICSISSFSTSQVIGDRDAIRFTSGFVGRRNLQNLVRVDIEGNLYLRNALGS